MLIEERVYRLHPEVPVTKFLEIYETQGLPIQKPILGGFLGYFITEFGVQNELTHWWAYQDLEDRRARREKLSRTPEWITCIETIRPMLISMENKIMYPASFSPIRNLPVRCDDPNTAFNWPADSPLRLRTDDMK